MKTKKGIEIGWFYWAIITLALLGFVVLLGFNTGVGNKLKSILFEIIGSLFG